MTIQKELGLIKYKLEKIVLELSLNMCDIEYFEHQL